MTHRALAVAAGLVWMLFGVTAGWTQADPTKLLLGRWNGALQTERGTYDRTLIVKSIEERTDRVGAGMPVVLWFNSSVRSTEDGVLRPAAPRWRVPGSGCPNSCLRSARSVPLDALGART